MKLMLTKAGAVALALTICASVAFAQTPVPEAQQTQPCLEGSKPCQDHDAQRQVSQPATSNADVTQRSWAWNLFWFFPGGPIVGTVILLLVLMVYRLFLLALEPATEKEGNILTQEQLFTMFACAVTVAPILAISLLLATATGGGALTATVTIIAEVCLIGSQNGIMRAWAARTLIRLADRIRGQREQANGAANYINQSAPAPNQQLASELASLRKQVADLTALSLLGSDDRLLLLRLRSLTGDLAQSLAQWQKDEALCPELVRLTAELDSKFFDILPQALLPMLEATLEALRKRAAFKKDVVQKYVNQLAEVQAQLQKVLADQANAQSPLRQMSEAAETLAKAQAALGPTGGTGQ